MHIIGTAIYIVAGGGGDLLFWSIEVNGRTVRTFRIVGYIVGVCC